MQNQPPSLPSQCRGQSLPQTSQERKLMCSPCDVGSGHGRSDYGLLWVSSERGFLQQQKPQLPD